MSWWTYVRQVTSDAQKEIARRSGLDQSQVSKWSSGTTPTPRPGSAAAFARAYDRPVLEAFVAAGFLTADEARVRPSETPSLADFSERQLLHEMQRRLELRELAEGILSEGVPGREALLALLSDASLTELSQVLEHRMEDLQDQIEEGGQQDDRQSEAEKKKVADPGPRTDVVHLDNDVVLHLRAGEDIPTELLDKLAAYIPGVEPGLRIPEQEQAGEENQDPGDDG